MTGMLNKAIRIKMIWTVGWPGYNIRHALPGPLDCVEKKNMLINSINRLGAHCGPVVSLCDAEYLIHFINIIKPK